MATETEAGPRTEVAEGPGGDRKLFVVRGRLGDRVRDLHRPGAEWRQERAVPGRDRPGLDRRRTCSAWPGRFALAELSTMLPQRRRALCLSPRGVSASYPRSSSAGPSSSLSGLDRSPRWPPAFGTLLHATCSSRRPSGMRQPKSGRLLVIACLATITAGGDQRCRHHGLAAGSRSIGHGD